MATAIPNVAPAAGRAATHAGWAGAVRHLRRNTLSVVGSVIVIALVAVAVLAPVL